MSDSLRIVTPLPAAPTKEPDLEHRLDVATAHLAAVRRAFGVPVDADLFPMRGALWNVDEHHVLQWFGSFRDGIVREKRAEPAPIPSVAGLAGFTYPGPNGRTRLIIFAERMRTPW